METVGVVKSVHGTMARVLMETGPSCCAHCEKGSCDIEINGVETEAVNLVQAKVGQKVKVDMKTGTYLKGALLLYVLPVAALFIGALLGAAWLPAYFHGANDNLLSAAGAVFLFLVSLVIVKLLSGRMEKKTENKSVIEAVIEE
jgi:sigma-E factor negative regulatory protein RseC